MGRDTIRQYLEVFAQAGVLDGPADALPESAALGEVARSVTDPSSPPPPSSCSSVERWKDEVVRLRSKGAGPTSIHDHLRVNEPEYSGSLSAIKRLCLRLERAEGPRAVDVAIPVETGPSRLTIAPLRTAGGCCPPQTRSSVPVLDRHRGRSPVDDRSSNGRVPSARVPARPSPATWRKLCLRCRKTQSSWTHAGAQRTGIGSWIVKGPFADPNSPS